MRQSIGTDTLPIMQVAFDINVKPEYSHMDLGKTVWDCVLHIETANAQYIIGYKDIYEMYIEHSELKPSYGGGYEWELVYRSTEPSPSHIAQYVYDQEGWYKQY